MEVYDTFDSLIDLCEENKLKPLASKLRDLRDKDIPIDLLNIDNYAIWESTGTTYPRSETTEDLIDTLEKMQREESSCYDIMNQIEIELTSRLQ